MSWREKSVMCRFDDLTIAWVIGNQKQVSSAAHSQQNLTGKSEETKKKQFIYLQRVWMGHWRHLITQVWWVFVVIWITLLIPNSVQVYRLKQGLQQSIPIESSYTKKRPDVLKTYGGPTSHPTFRYLSRLSIRPPIHPPIHPIIINHHQSSSIIINHHQSSSIIINHHQSSSIIINHHQSSSIIINHHQSSSIIYSIHLISSNYTWLTRRNHLVTDGHCILIMLVEPTIVLLHGGEVDLVLDLQGAGCFPQRHREVWSRWIPVIIRRRILADEVLAGAWWSHGGPLLLEHQSSPMESNSMDQLDRNDRIGTPPLRIFEVWVAHAFKTPTYPKKMM